MHSLNIAREICQSCDHKCTAAFLWLTVYIRWGVIGAEILCWIHFLFVSIEHQCILCLLSILQFSILLTSAAEITHIHSIANSKWYCIVLWLAFYKLVQRRTEMIFCYKISVICLNFSRQHAGQMWVFLGLEAWCVFVCVHVRVCESKAVLVVDKLWKFAVLQHMKLPQILVLCKHFFQES